MVDVELVQRFNEVITLDRLRHYDETKLREMLLLKRGNRLSITPVTKEQWRFITSLASK